MTDHLNFDDSVVDNYHYYNKKYNGFLYSTFNESKTHQHKRYYNTWPCSYLTVVYTYKKDDVEEDLEVMIDIESLSRYTYGLGGHRCGGLKCRAWSDYKPIKGNWCASCFGDEPDSLFSGLMGWYNCKTLKQLLKTGVTLWINYAEDHKLFYNQEALEESDTDSESDTEYDSDFDKRSKKPSDYDEREYTKKEDADGTYYYSFSD